VNEQCVRRSEEMKDKKKSGGNIVFARSNEEKNNR